MSVFFVALVALASYVAHRSSLRVSQVVLSGGILVSSDAVASETTSFLSGSYFFLFPKNNIFLYPRAGLEADLKAKFQRIATISVGRGGNLHTLVVTITERTPSALWCEGDPTTATSTTDVSTCFFMDDTSTIFAQAPSFSGDAYFKYYGDVSSTTPISANPIGQQYIASSTLFADVSRFVESVRTLDIRPQYLVTNDVDDFTLELAGGGKIYIDTDEPLTKASQNLQALLQRTPSLTLSTTRDLPVDYIDLRYGNKLFYKLSGTSIISENATSTKI